MWCKMLISLAFVPTPQISAAFIELQENMPEQLREELTDVFDWFEDYYVGRLNGNGTRRPCLFNSAIW